MVRWGDYWRFTSRSAGRLFEGAFGAENTTVAAFGDLRTATCFLWGLAAEDLAESELRARDEDYEVLIAVRAVKQRRS
jgi:hypothetical protein